MGADGGVCFVPMRDPSRYARAIELIRPFYTLLECPWKRGCNAEQTDEWERAHPEIASSSNYVMGYYGTNKDFDLGDVAEMFRYYDDLDTVVPDPSLTFGELLQDLATRPMGWPGSVSYLEPWWDRFYFHPPDINGRYLSPIEQILWSTFGWRADEADTCDSFAPIRNMNVVEWTRELERLCHWGSFRREETWT